LQQFRFRWQVQRLVSLALQMPDGTPFNASYINVTPVGIADASALGTVQGSRTGSSSGGAVGAGDNGTVTGVDGPGNGTLGGLANGTVNGTGDVSAGGVTDGLVAALASGPVNGTNDGAAGGLAGGTADASDSGTAEGPAGKTDDDDVGMWSTGSLPAAGKRMANAASGSLTSGQSSLTSLMLGETETTSALTASCETGTCAMHDGRPDTGASPTSGRKPPRKGANTTTPVADAMRILIRIDVPLISGSNNTTLLAPMPSAASALVALQRIALNKPWPVATGSKVNLTIKAVQRVERVGTCGDGVCQLSERQFPGNFVNCTADCSFAYFACPPFNSIAPVCNGVGSCFTNVGACNCFTG